MHRGPVAVEEQLFQRAIKEECPWENLPKRLQLNISSKEEWHRRIIEYCIRKRLQWNNCFARKVCKENEYYEDMMRYLRKNLALFPYHLAEYICRIMRISPFKYYCDIIFEVLKNEQPYDSIPNFSADLRKSSLVGICLVNFTLEEFKKLSEEEAATIDKICKEEANSFIIFDPDVVKGLYRRGLVYFDVPVYPDDRFKVSRLEGFVSNREQSYEDPIEELLYAVFVVSSENATVTELAATLQADLPQLQAAASFACRLGWATKVIDPSAILQDINIPSSPRSAVSDEDGSHASLGSENLLIDNDTNQQGDVSGSGNHGLRLAYTRVAFIVDANITSYLMMGSVSPGLKSHAVTLYEAGKLGHASIADLCKDLSTLEGAKFEGELQEFANHAFSLRCVLECLQSGGLATDAKAEEKFDSMETRKDRDDVLNLEKKKHEDTFASFEPAPSSTLDGIHSITLEDDINHKEEASESDANLQTNKKLIAADASDLGIEILKGQKKYRVDILRCESLASLAPATLDRLFIRDYDIVVSIVPLPHSSILPGPAGPVHFGPPSYSSMTPWMKLVLYSSIASGPLSVVLMKGQCMRMLPAPLAGCEKALIWSWDGSTVGGLGGKLEGSLVKGSILLHCLNSLLKHSALLVQPLSRYDLDDSGNVITIDIPLPLKNSDGSIAPVGKGSGLCEAESSKLNSLLTDLANKMELWTVGYIRLLKLFHGKEPDHLSPEENYEWVPLSVEFGIPLFSPKLCNKICKKVVSSDFLQTGPAAKLLYQKEHAKESSRQLMNYASGRWNPFLDPSSPILGASSEHQRLKLVNRQRGKTEILSFDGNILRSYSLTGYDDIARPTGESQGNNMARTEPDESDSKEVVLPGVNLIFDGSGLHPFDIGACLQGRQPVSLISEAAAASASAIK
ncbi:hypothetical protein K1719_046109 [Acacia pycnantha]|nr:hypothetical protein K1719_046109 [Acacia pycnantha]